MPLVAPSKRGLVGPRGLFNRRRIRECSFPLLCLRLNPGMAIASTVSCTCNGRVVKGPLRFRVLLLLLLLLQLQLVGCLVGCLLVGCLLEPEPFRDRSLRSVLDPCWLK